MKDLLLFIIIILLIICLSSNASNTPNPKKNNTIAEKFTPTMSNKNITADTNIKTMEDEYTDEESDVEESEVEESEVEDAEVEDTDVEDVDVEDVDVEDASVEDVEVEDASVEDAEVEDTGVEDTSGEKNVNKPNKDIIGYNFANADNYEMVSNDNVKIDNMKIDKKNTKYNSVIQNQNAAHQKNIMLDNDTWNVNLAEVSKLTKYVKPLNANTNTVDIKEKNKKSYNSKDYLPKEINDEWFNTDFLQAENKINDNKLINTDKYITGIDTTGQSLKNPTYDIRGTIPNPKISVSPWNNSTYEPDTNLKSLC